MAYLKRESKLQDLSYAGGGESQDDVSDIKQDLEGWREVLLPLTSLMRWDRNYYPAIIFGTTTFLFSIVWYTELSTLTAVSFACMIIGIVDFIVPFMGPTITGYKTWTGDQEREFTEICTSIASIRQDAIDTCLGFSAMRQQNAKLFFVIVMGILTATAWIGNLIDNLFLTYLVVNFLLLFPGLRHNQIAGKYLQPIVRFLNKIKAKTVEQTKKID